ncbi:DM13 domain-containing protein [Streptomyces sp. NPDC058701]|uniref:DM13 domain-containing protein n=1 Tax=Streptomyces sp. NPDC058701 TaxID=3346608 RepID=UPI003662200A
MAETKRRRGRLFTGGLVAGTLVAGVGLYWFQPWKLWQDTTVSDALPTAPAAVAPPGAASPTVPAATPATPATLSGGTFTSHEHATTGKAALIRLPDGSHTLRLEDLDTSDGPDLRVWLTDAPVLEGVAGWRVFDDGAHVSLGKLKGNKGDQNYALPAGVNPADYTSVTIWCDRFDVSFGAAALTGV